MRHIDDFKINFKRNSDHIETKEAAVQVQNALKQELNGS